MFLPNCLFILCPLKQAELSTTFPQTHITAFNPLSLNFYLQKVTMKAVAILAVFYAALVAAAPAPIADGEYFPRIHLLYNNH